MVAAKRVDPPGPEDGGTTGGLKSFSEEKGATEPEPTPIPPSQEITQEEAEAWLDVHLSEIPRDPEIGHVGQHCWLSWGPHWGGGWSAAWSVWTKDTSSRKKFRKDAVRHLQKVGLPVAQSIDREAEWAREVTAGAMDRRIAEYAQARGERTVCAGCGVPRLLLPGVTHCYLCRQLLVEITA